MRGKQAKEPRACQVCGSKQHLVRAVAVRPAVAAFIRSEAGEWSETGWICEPDLDRARHRYVKSLLEEDKGELTTLENEVLESLRTHELLTTNVESEFESSRTLGQRVADRIASFGGSWPFIFLFAFVLFGWLFINSVLLAARPFDPYPYILLNLILSCLAAVQAPVIMMSQNRQEERDRLRAIHDYQINLKAELEIRHLNQKVDHLLSHQWERLLEIQEIQMDLMDELRAGRGTGGSGSHGAGA
ncbi:MAG: DUF1003 domain-containing protein [Acidobacteria bacterium]|nr:DUF1003 domain-containing protein [Acidobacteriota bacterium]